jgi:glucosamine-6-phosphate deaminase
VNIVKKKDYAEMSQCAADFVADRIRTKTDFVLGCATGSTPLRFYQELVEWCRAGELDLSEVTTFNLDEYCGLPSHDPHSYRFYMNQHLFSGTHIAPSHTHFPSPEDPAGYEAAIRDAGGIDLQIVGIGENGHIGFNEPGSSFDSRTRVVELSESTVKSNARFFDKASDVPRKVVTMGIATTLEAREIVLLASGAHKAGAVHKALKGPVTEEVPASVLQQHKNVTVFLDEEAARKLC